ncbi:MAG: glycosyltransferase [Patescibacteria group bacterium]|jgi:glycosyltransferase involved in cell wall biosynthesis
MKILFLNHNQEKVGTYYRCFFLGKYLSQIGYQITMICASGKSFDLRIRRQKINDNFTIITLPRIKYSRYLTGQLLLRLPLTIFYIFSLSYDICHAFTVAQPQIGIPAWVAKKIRGKKLIVDWDDLWGGGFADYHAWPIKPVLSWFENSVPRLGDRITYVSEYLGERINKLGLMDRAAKIPNGSDPEKILSLDKAVVRQKLGLALDKKYLVAMGNTYLESFALMLTAFAEVVKKNSNAFLILLGNAEISPALQDLFAKIKDNVIIGGFVPIEKAAAYLSAADVLVLPMDSNPIEFARFPIRLGDYLCAGRPVVSNAVGEVKYYLEKYNCGLISAPQDTDAMANNVLTLLSDQEQSQKLGLAARQVAENILPWKKAAFELSTVYNDLASEEVRNKKISGIIILSPFYEPNTGGVETHLRDLSKYLVKQDYRVAVLTYQPLTTKAKAPIWEQPGEGFIIHRIPWVGHNLFHKLEEHPFFQFLYLTPILFVYTFFFLLFNRRKYEVIHAHGLTSALISNFMQKIFHIRFVVSMHAIYGFRPDWWLAKVCRFILAPAKKIFCLAEASRDDIRQLDLEEKRLDLYIQWVDQDNFKPRDKKECRATLKLTDKFTVLFVGRLIEKKGAGVLLEVAKKLPNINFIFIGDGPMYDDLKKAEGISGNVIAAGKKEQEEVAEYFGACNVVVVPSQYPEGFARVVLETLSSGRPIIAANAGCLPEMITEKVGVLLEPTAENITNQLEDFYNNPDKLLALEANCREYALEHFGEAHAKPIEESYYITE